MCRGGCNRVMYEGSHCSVVNSASVYIGSHEKLCMLNGSSCSNINLGRQVVCFKDLSSATSSSSSSALLHKPSSAFTKCHVSTVAKVQADKSAQLPIKISATNRRKGKSRNRSVPVHGMLQQRETKAKTERGDGDFLLDSRMSFKDRVKSKFHLKHCEGKEDSIEDPEDPYAFPDPVSVDVLKTSTTNPSHNSSSTTITTCTTTTTTTTTTITTTTATTTTTTITTNNINTNNNNIIVFGNAAAVTVSNAVSCSTVSGSGCSGGGGGGGGGGCGGLSTSGKPMESGASHQPLHWVRTSGEAGTTTASSAIGTPIAKLYPELAEKLEGRRTQKPDQKKGKVESSRTMNRLQTKIAQNKIKDKLKKTQDYPGNPTPCFSSTSLTTPSLNLSSSACCKTASESAVALAFMKPSPSVVLTSATTSTTTSTVTNTTTSTTTTTVTKPVTDSGFSISETHVKTSPHISTAALSPGLTQVPISTPPSQLPPSPLQTPFHTASSHTNSLQNMSSATNPTLNVTTSELKVSHKQPVSPTSPLSHSLPNCHLKSPCPNSTKCEAIWSPSHAVPHSPQHTEHKFSVLHTKPNKLNVPDNKEVISKLKSESAMAFYMMHQKKAIQNHDWLNCGLNSSEDDENSEDEHLPWQNDWLVLSSDEDVKDENLSPHYRSRKLAIRRAQLRRQVVQSQVAGCFNANIQLNKNKATLALIHALRDKPPAALKSLHFVLNKPQRKCNVHKMSSLRKRFCCYQNEDDGKCNKKALPCTNHCIKHIMYNVDQQLFDYCTAKFADNTQCCVPVFDIKHDLPLCEEHAAKADNYQRVQSNESKHKRPRKKPKPAALTRPPKKGKKKKKKNQRRNVRPQESVRRAERLENTEPGSVDESSNIVVSVSSTAASNSGAIASPTVATSQSTIPTTTAVLDTSGMLQDSLISAPEKTGNILPNLPPTKRAPISLHIPMELPPVTSSSTVGSSAELNHIDFAKLSKNFQDLGSVLDGGFSPDSIDKSFELPLDQASKLLEQDLQEVFNNDTFDIFSAGRNGEYDPTKEESEDLERALAAAYKDIRDAKEKLDKLSRVGDQSSQLMDVNDEEWTKDIADSILNSVQTNTVPVTATNLTPGNGLASELMKDNLNVLDNSDLTANSLPMSSQVVNQPVGSIATAASNGGNSVLPYGWINFNMASVPSSLAEQPLSNNLFINSKHVPLASTQSIASDLALTSAHISTNVPHLSSSIYRSASSNRTVLSTNSKETAMEGNTSLRHMVPQHSATEPKPLSSSESPLVTSQQATCQEVTHTISSQSAAVTSAQTVLSAHVSMNSQTSTQLATSIQMPSSQTAILPTLLSMQGGSLRPGIWPSAGVTAGIPVQYYNGLPTSARIPFVQNMDSGLPPGSSAKFQLNSHLDSGDYKQDLTFTSLPHSMGSSHGGAQRTRTEKSQGSMPGSVTKSNSSGENT